MCEANLDVLESEPNKQVHINKANNAFHHNSLLALSCYLLTWLYAEHQYKSRHQNT